MPIKKKRCQFCHAWFSPDPRTPQQKCCGSPACRKQRKKAADKRWRLNNPGYDKTRAAKKRAWAQSCDYWSRYRQARPAYAAADGKRRCKSYKARKFSANQDARRQITVELLASTRAIATNPSANQDAIARRVDIIAGYLFPEAPSANPNDTDSRPRAGP